jgi:hypothetical protein
MRSLLPAALLAAAAVVVSSPTSAQELQINQRLTAPTSQADAYAGATLGRLILALGLSLQGLPPDLRGETLRSHLQAMADAERRPVRAKTRPVPAPLIAAQPVLPAAAAAQVLPAAASVAPAAVLPAAVQTVPLPAK